MTNTTTRRAERQRAHRNHWILGIGTLTVVAVITVFAHQRWTISRHDGDAYW